VNVCGAWLLFVQALKLKEAQKKRASADEEASLSMEQRPEWDEEFNREE
jgi:hypothetical protein